MEFQPERGRAATISTGIARPGFEQNSTAASIDRTSDPLPDHPRQPGRCNRRSARTSNSISRPTCRRAASAEVGLFEKDFTNYIVPRIQNGITTDPLAPGHLADVITFLNIPQPGRGARTWPTIRSSIFLPRPFDGLGIESNLTLVDSEIIEYQPPQTAQVQRGLLPGTSPGDLEPGRLSTKPMASTSGCGRVCQPQPVRPRGDKTLDVLQDDRLTLDFTSAYRIDKNLAGLLQRQEPAEHAPALLTRAHPTGRSSANSTTPPSRLAYAPTSRNPTHEAQPCRRRRACRRPLATTAAAAPSYTLSDHLKVADGGWDYASFDPVHGKVFISRGGGVTVVDVATKAVSTLTSPGAGRMHESLPLDRVSCLL